MIGGYVKGAPSGLLANLLNDEGFKQRAQVNGVFQLLRDLLALQMSGQSRIDKMNFRRLNKALACVRRPCPERLQNKSRFEERKIASQG